MTAKEMFEELGFIENDNFKDVICYEYFNNLGMNTAYVVFDKKARCYQIDGLRCPMSDGSFRNYPISFELHKAINKQIKELEWINDC